MATEKPFGNWLRKRRRMLDLTQQELADQAGCARITLRRIESGELKPSKELARILLEKVGIPAQEQDNWILFTRGLSASPPESHPDDSHQGPPTNLPAALTTFIGREKEQAEVTGLISKHRLVTLTGSGGVGKTRLSLKVGDQVLGDYYDGAWLVELAALNEPEFLPQTVAAVFGITSSSSTSPMELLLHYLKPKTALLILDNCEHLLDACARLADTLLKNCPYLKILATSRETLDIPGEAVYRVPSLRLPDLQQLVEKIREFESVRLFEERASLVKSDFALTGDNALSIAQICQRLDGIPLALELAAAQVIMFSPAEIAAQLDECFRILTGGSRTALPRQQTIRASIDWSWNLLSNAERVFLRRLSVFAAGWTQESAQAINDDNVSGLTHSLVRKSLIEVDQKAGSVTRYSLHEIIRQYTRERLVEAGEESAVLNRHLIFFLELSEKAESGLRGPLVADWLARLHMEVDDLRTALRLAESTGDTQSGLYLASRLLRFWEEFDILEGIHWLDKFLQMPASQDFPCARAKALHSLGEFMWHAQRFPQAHAAAKECLELFRHCGDQRGEVDALLLLAKILHVVKDPLKSFELGQRAYDLAYSLGDTWRQANSLAYLGFWDSKDHKNRVDYLERAIMLYREAGDLGMVAGYLGVLGNYEMLNGDFELAGERLDECIRLCRRLKHPEVQFALACQGRIACMQGDFEHARAFFQESLAISEKKGWRMDILWIRTYLGFLTLREGKVDEALSLLAETLRDFQREQNTGGVVFTLEGLAGHFGSTTEPALAARLIGWADARRQETGDWRPLLEQADIDKAIQASISQMGKAAFSGAYAEGQKMSMEQAVASALEEK